MHLSNIKLGGGGGEVIPSLKLIGRNEVDDVRERGKKKEPKRAFMLAKQRISRARSRLLSSKIGFYIIFYSRGR